MKLKQLLEITIENQDNEKRLTGKDLNILNSIVKLNQIEEFAGKNLKIITKVKKIDPFFKKSENGLEFVIGTIPPITMVNIEDVEFNDVIEIYSIFLDSGIVFLACSENSIIKREIIN